MPELLHVIPLAEAYPFTLPKLAQIGDRPTVTLVEVALNCQRFIRIMGPLGTEHYPQDMSCEDALNAYWGITHSLEAAVKRLWRAIEEATDAA